MKCVIRSNNVVVPQALRRRITAKIEQTFTRLNDKVKFVVVSFQDVNGSRGGVDKQCKIKVIGHDQVDVYVAKVHESTHGAFSSALIKAHQTFTNRIKRLIGRVKRRSAMRAYQDIELLANAS